MLHDIPKTLSIKSLSPSEDNSDKLKSVTHLMADGRLHLQNQRTDSEDIASVNRE